MKARGLSLGSEIRRTSVGFLDKVLEIWDKKMGRVLGCDFEVVSDGL